MKVIRMGALASAVGAVLWAQQFKLNLDHLAAKYLSDAAGYWRIAERNDAVLPESLSEAREIEIPGR